MGDKELEQYTKEEIADYVSRLAPFATTLKDNVAGAEIGKVVAEYVSAVARPSRAAASREAKDKAFETSVFMQPYVIGVDWSSVFMTPLNVEFSVTTLRNVLEALWILGGPRAISAFFSMKTTDTSTIKSLANSLSELDPTELGTQYHLPVVVDRLEHPFALNYEPIAAFFFHALRYYPEFAKDATVISVCLFHAAKVGSKVEEVKEEIKVLQDGAETILNNPPEYMPALLRALSKSPLAYIVFEKSASSEAFVRAVAKAKAISLLSAWCDKETGNGTDEQYEAAIDVAVRADLIAPSSEWAHFLTTSIGSDSRAYGVLIDYMMKSKPPNGQLKSLRTVSAVAMLTQTVEAPGDRADRTEQTRALQLQLLHDYPRLINYGQGHDEAIMANTDLPTFNQDIEAEMKMCFQRMYEQQHDIQEVIAMLERLKQSNVPRDQDLFACMIHSLFDEYRFFPQYPVQALATTAVLFGSLIHFRLIEGIPLSIALKYILDALRQDTDSNMFRFGLQALVELRQRLPELPKYCKVLLTIPGLQNQHQFYSQIKGIADPEAEDEAVAQFRSLNPVIDDEDTSPTNEEVSRKVVLIVNNLTAKTLAEKAEEISAELNALGVLKFAKIIIARAVNEPNYHELYVKLLDSLPQEVSSCCVDVIITRVSLTLNSPDALTAEKRTSVKNLGQMLGMLTLARDKPLLFHQINLKLLLAEGARYDKLPAVIPFVTKILAQSAGSKVFGSTSPFLNNILAVLSELYWFSALKLNLKFEIEVLATSLKVNIPKIEPTVYIRDEVRQQEDTASIMATYGGPTALSSLAQVAVPQPSLPQINGLARPVSGGVSPVNLPAGVAPGGPQIPGQLPGFGSVPGPPGALGAVPGAPGVLPPMSSATPGVPLVGTTEFVNHPGLRQLLDLSRSKTIQDVLLPIIDRSVSIASFTAKELVLKDMALEPDEGMLQAAAHSQALVLASSMAIVTTKDPFIDALAHNLRTLVISQGYGDAQILLDQVNIAARETMDSLVPLIESVAREKVVVEVDEALLPQYAARQQARALGRRFEPEDYKEPPIKLPELLSVRSEGLLPEQMAVYEQFALQPYSSGDALGPHPAGSQNLQVDLQELVEQISKLEALAKGNQKRLGEHNKDDEVLSLLSDITTTARNGARRSEEVPLRASHLVVQALFGPESTNSTLYRESLCYVLGELCRMSGITAKEVVLWLLYADDTKKYNSNVIGTLLRSRLVTPTEIDASLTKDLADAATKPSVVDYAARLLLDALIGPEPYCLRSDFAGSILALSKLNVKEFPAANVLIQTLQETRGKGSGNEGHVFAEWTRLMQHHATANSPVLLHAFVHDMYTLGGGSSPEQLVQFIRTAVTVSVRSYLQSNSFVGVDAVAVLITTILSTAKENAQLARTLFSVVALLIAKDHDDSENFEALPYFRLLSSVACSVPPVYINEFAETLVILQPPALPGFASSWITLMSHRFVMGRLIDNKDHWPMLFELLSTLLMFLRQVWLSPVSDAASRGFVYRASERICLVILHDAPGFFIRYANDITALLVFEFVQLRNLVLCAFAEGTELPHPVDIGSIEYADVHPSISIVVDESRQLLKDRNTVKLVENACMPRPQLTPQIVSAIQTSLAYSKPMEDKGVDFDFINVSTKGYNAFATYVAHLYTLHPAPSGKVEDSSAAQLCARMLLTLSKDNRYAFVSAIANHLRYPEKHTFFYSRFLLALFTPFGERMFKDGIADARQIVTRVLLERLMAHRPHPWGLMATFAELLRNSQYNFWEMPFIKTSTEIAGLFSTLYSHVSRIEVQT